MSVALFAFSFLIWCVAVFRQWRGVSLVPAAIISLPFALGSLFSLFPIGLFIATLITGSLGANEILATNLFVFGAGLLALGARAAPRLLPPKTVVNRVAISLLWGLVILVGTVGAGNFVKHATTSPHGQWDAWAIWNTKARFIARSETKWDAFLTSDLGAHPDYPILSPLLVGGGWKMLKGEDLLVPVAVGGLSALGVALALIAVGYGVGRPILGLLAALVLANTPLAYFGTFQQADIPLAFFTILSLAALAASNLRQPFWLTLAGLFAGAALFTKNEGSPFLCGLIFSAALILGIRKDLRAFLWLFLGITPGVIARLALMLRYPIENDLVGAAIDKGIQWDRAQPVWIAFVDYLPDRAMFVALLFLPLVVMNLIHASHARRGLILIFAAVTSIQLVAYFFSYLISPYHLAWHIGSSMNRLVFHLTLLTIALLIVALSQPPAHKVSRA